MLLIFERSPPDGKGDATALRNSGEDQVEFCINVLPLSLHKLSVFQKTNKQGDTIVTNL